MAADAKESACNTGDLGSIPGLGRSSGEGNGNHSSILAWKITGTEEPVRLQKVRHDLATKQQQEDNLSINIFHSPLRYILGMSLKSYTAGFLKSTLLIILSCVELICIDNDY